MRKQVGLEVTNGAPIDYRRVGLTVCLIGIIRIMLRRNVVYAHPAAGKTRIGLSAAPWSAGGKPCRAVASSGWTAAPGPSVDFASPHKPQTYTRIAYADGDRTDQARSWHSPKTMNSAAPSLECSISRRRPALHLSSLRGMSSGIGTPAADSWTVSAPKNERSIFERTRTLWLIGIYYRWRESWSMMILRGYGYHIVVNS